MKVVVGTANDYAVYVKWKKSIPKPCSWIKMSRETGNHQPLFHFDIFNKYEVVDFTTFGILCSYKSNCNWTQTWTTGIFNSWYMKLNI